MPDREPTYDDVVLTPGGDSYRGNGIELGKTPVWQHVESTKVKLNDGFVAIYRSYIETEAGQVWVNIFYIWMPGASEGMKNAKVVLKLLNSPDNIQIRNIGEGLGGGYSLYEIILTVEIPLQLNPGDYDVEFILFINEKYEGTLPCIIHVVNKYSIPNPVPTLQSGYEISQGTMPHRVPTYDDVVTASGGASYRGNVMHLGKMPIWQDVESTQVKIDSGLEVSYRSRIDTEAGQVRVNIFNIYHMPDTPGGMKYDKVVLKLLNSPDNIRVRKIEEELTGDESVYSIIITTEIPPEAKPGDYDVAFILFINEKYRGTLPCIIHVIE